MSAAARMTVARAAAPRLAALGHVACAGAALAGFGGLLCAVGLKAAGVPLGPLELLLCAGPALVAGGFGFTSQHDRDQYVARILAAALMLPMLLMMWATSLPSGLPGWVEGTAAFGFIAVHLLAFAGVCWQLAASATRIAPEHDTLVVPEFVLEARLKSAVAHLPSWQLQRGSTPHEWVLDATTLNAEGRFHRVLLNVDAARAQVQVRERLGADGAAPRDAEEASLRSLGDEAFDPTRPDAQRVSARLFQTTMLEPARLAAVQLQLRGGEAHTDAATRQACAQPEGLLALLATVATRSGYVWRPVMALRG